MDEHAKLHLRLVNFLEGFIKSYEHEWQAGEWGHETTLLKAVLDEFRTDYRSLLKAYMDHIIDNEGDNYIEFIGFNGRILNDEQKAELKEIAKELKTTGKNYTVKK